jgi:hypothetical protein
VDHTKPLTLDQLTKIAQDRVRKGISANSAADAERKYQELVDPRNGNVAHTGCPAPSGSMTPGPTTSPSDGGSAEASGTHVPPASGSITATPAVPGTVSPSLSGASQSPSATPPC